MNDDRLAACLLHGIYDKGPMGMDRRECAVCHGDRCPYVVEPTAPAACPNCFGTGIVMVSAELDVRDAVDSVCRRCNGTGRLTA